MAELTIQQRAEKVLASQGKASVFLTVLDDEHQASLAELCSPAGDLVSGVRDTFAEWLAEYYDEQKAEVDPSEGE